MYLAVYYKVSKVNFISFPSKSPGKARECDVSKLYLGVRCQPKKKTDYNVISRTSARKNGCRKSIKSRLIVTVLENTFLL